MSDNFGDAFGRAGDHLAHGAQDGLYGDSLEAGLEADLDKYESSQADGTPKWEELDDNNNDDNDNDDDNKDDDDDDDHNDNGNDNDDRDTIRLLH